MTKKRKSYFVKPKLQIKYLLILASVIALLAVLIYYIFLDSLLNAPGMDQLSAGAVKNFIRTYTGGFFWVTLLFAVLILTESVFYFHRIVGPIYFFEKVTEKLAQGNFSVNVHHRKKDETKQLANNMKIAVENVRTAVSQDRKKIELIKEAIDNGKTEEAKNMLDELTGWFKIKE